MSSAEGRYQPLRPLLLDVSAVPQCCTDEALEGLFKALRDEDGRRDDAWLPHADPWLSELVEIYTQKGLGRLQALREALLRWLRDKDGATPSGVVKPSRPALFAPWTQQHAEDVRRYLEALPPGALDASDLALLVEYLVRRYLPLEELAGEAEWLVTKAVATGVLRAHSAQAPEAAAVAAVLPMLPSVVDELVRSWRLSDAAQQVLSYAREQAAGAVVGLTEAARAGIRQEVLQHMRARVLGEPLTWQSLQARLLERFDALNRDWRRIAVTEATEAAGQGVIAALPPGALVRRIEMYHGACEWCRRLDGKVMRVVSPDKEDKDGWSEVWPGKTNVGRSRSPHKRVGDALVPRSPDELWWPAAGAQHPHCRGRWEPVKVPQSKPSPAVAELLQKLN